MARTTSELVSGIIEVDVNISLDPFIEVANELVTEACGDYGHTDTRLELIERWLAAHFYAMRDPRPLSEKAGPVSETFQSKVGLNLAVSHYGQQAMVLDTSGGLAAMSRKATTGKRIASASWVGVDADRGDAEAYE
jgi:hypothetical protein